MLRKSANKPLRLLWKKRDIRLRAGNMQTNERVNRNSAERRIPFSLKNYFTWKGSGMLSFLGIGDNVCDKYRNRKMMYPGGQALNVAVYAHQLGAKAAYMGVFGDDAVAAHVIHTLDELDIDRSRCRQYPGENGYAVVDFENGDRYFVMSNKGGIVNTHPLVLTADDILYMK